MKLTIYDCFFQCTGGKKILSETMKKCMSLCKPAKYTAPLIWVGFYIAAASLLCMLAMGTDLFNGLRRKKSWFPCKFFTLNPAISAVLAIALKMPVDLSTSMPCGRDQFMKLSATALMSVSMGNFMPSLAAMSDKELLANLMALIVFIIPLISNIGIQIGTEVIFRSVAAHHIIILFFIVFQLVLLVSTAVACPTMKQQLKDAYDKEADSPITSSSEDINEELKKQSIMAQTSNPQFVISRSVICTASGAICVLTVLVLAHALVKLYTIMSKKQMFFFPSSNYQWSATFIGSIQAAAVIVGSISPISRWFTVVWFNFEEFTKSCGNDLWSVEPYWTQRLKDWKGLPLGLNPKHVKFNNFIGNWKVMLLNIFIILQNSTVLSCKFLRLVSFVFLFPFMFVYNIKKRAQRKGEHQPSWVLKLEGEPDLPKSTIQKIISVSYSYFNKGTKKAVPENQINSLEKSYGFDGIKEFDKILIKELTKMTIDGVSINPNGCWAIRIVTLSTIVCAIKATWDEKFVSAVTGLLPHVIYVEKALAAGQTNMNLGDLVVNVWSDVHKSRKWLNTELPINGESLKCILEALKTSSPEKQKKYHPGVVMWMNETVDVLIKFSGRELDTQNFCEQMTRMVLDILATCLKNLETALTVNISKASLEERELVVQKVFSIYVKTFQIQEIAKRRFSSIIDLDDKEYLLASWWKAVKPKNTLEDEIKKLVNRQTIGFESKSTSK